MTGLTTALIGTYPPRACGIATFTRDLRDGLRLEPAASTGAGASPWIVALDHGQGLDPDTYPAEVRHRLGRGDRAGLHRVVTALIADEVQAVSLQHEFGIYGGQAGREVLDIARALPIPLVTTFHTVLARPDPLQLEIVRDLSRLSAAVVVMTERGRALLRAQGIPDERIAVIPHGVPDLPLTAAAPFRARLGMAERRIILSFGLLGPGKGLELAIDGLASIARTVPDAVLVICGATHPEVRRQSGEAYRRALQDRAGQHGLENRVHFVDRYLGQAELLDWLQAADVFVTPYPNAAQITSGTLAYAVAAGKAVVATPYEHARELLADGRGILVPFGDAAALGDAFRYLLTDDAAREAMRRRAWAHSRAATWASVASRYADLLGRAAHGIHAAPRSLDRATTDLAVAAA